MSTDTTTTSVEKLRRELEDIESSSETEASTHEGPTEELVAAATVGLGPPDTFEFNDGLVKESLEELLLVLVALSDGSTHGKGLMGDLADVFGVRLSPGTVYPRLHDLEEEGVLEMHELVRTKEYRIADAEAARRRVHGALRQHIALGATLNTAIDEL